MTQKKEWHVRKRRRFPYVMSNTTKRKKGKRRKMTAKTEPIGPFLGVKRSRRTNDSHYFALSDVQYDNRKQEEDEKETEASEASVSPFHMISSLSEQARECVKGGGCQRKKKGRKERGVRNAQDSKTTTASPFHMICLWLVELSFFMVNRVRKIENIQNGVSEEGRKGQMA